jgi:hypothetical protein
MAERYPGYDVLKKRNFPSWNDQTRRAIDERLAIDPDQHQFFTDAEWLTPCGLRSHRAADGSPPVAGTARRNDRQKNAR